MPIRLDNLLESMNIKELISITAGLVGSQMITDATPNMDPKTRDLIKIGIGLGVPFIMNAIAEKGIGAGREIGAYVGLAASAIGADAIASRIKVSVAAAKKLTVASPVVVVEKESARSSAKRVVSI